MLMEIHYPVKRFTIDCDLGWDETLSYQDSFKWYNMGKKLQTTMVMVNWILELLRIALIIQKKNMMITTDIIVRVLHVFMSVVENITVIPMTLVILYG